MSRLKRVIQEIHRRSLWQALGIYLAGPWAAFQDIEIQLGCHSLCLTGEPG